MAHTGALLSHAFNRPALLVDHVNMDQYTVKKQTKLKWYSNSKASNNTAGVYVPNDCVTCVSLCYM